jgi:8-oxo-dGTP pyrophosphatase MutT (NUDIX family)
MLQDIISRIRTGFTRPLPGRSAQERMTGRVIPMPESLPENVRDSAVLQLIYPVDGVPHMLFMRRTEDGRAHSGQISFPGGRWEAQDENFMQTALREAAEEVGLQPGSVEVLGAMTPLYIPVSYFMVHPFVAWADARPDYRPNADEVSELIELPFDYLLDPANKIRTQVRPSSMPDLVLDVPAYKIPDGSIIWGATAMMLAELEALMEA